MWAYYSSASDDKITNHENHAAFHRSVLCWQIGPEASWVTYCSFAMYRTLGTPSYRSSPGLATHCASTTSFTTRAAVRQASLVRLCRVCGRSGKCKCNPSFYPCSNPCTSSLSAVSVASGIISRAKEAVLLLLSPPPR